MGQILLEVEGMTCGGCVKRVREKLEEVDGVVEVDVSLEKKQAVVTGTMLPEKLIKAVDAVGKKARILTPQEVQLTVEGMTCMGCVKRVTAALQGVAGVSNVAVSLSEKLATVTGTSSPQELINAVEEVGKRASILSVEDEYMWVVLGVTKMTCNGCKKKITQALQDVSGVLNVLVSLKEQVAVIRGKELDAHSLMDAVVAANKTPELLYESARGMKICLWNILLINEKDRESMLAHIEGIMGVTNCRLQPSEELLLVVGSVQAIASVRKHLSDVTCEVKDAFDDSGKSSKREDLSVLTRTQDSAPMMVLPISPIRRGDTVDINGSEVTDEADSVRVKPDVPINVDEVHLKVSGMTCATCVGIVERVLTDVSGVLKATVNLMASRATVQYDPVLASKTVIIKAVNQSGYKAEEITMSSDPVVYIKFENGSPSTEKARRIISAAYPQIACKIVSVSEKASWQSVLGNFAAATQPGKQSLLCLELPKDSTKHGDGPNIFIEIYRKLQEETALGLWEVVPATDSAISGDRNPSYVLSQSERKYLLMFLASLLFAIPVFALKVLERTTPEASPIKRDLMMWVFATPVQFVCGGMFYRGAYYALKRRRANMDSLIALGSSVAYFFSAAFVLYNLIYVQTLPGSTIFDTSVLLITFVLFGKWLETIAKRRAADGVSELNCLRPPTATFMTRVGDEFTVAHEGLSVELILPGDYLRVKPGERCPVDGVVVLGESSVNESMLTGESDLVLKGVGDSVFAGAINSSNMLILRALSVGNDTLLSRVALLVEEAQTSRAGIEAMADRVSAIFVPSVVLLSLATTSLWFLLCSLKLVPGSWYETEGAFLFSISFGLAVLVVACPCALGLATPTVVMVATGLAAQFKVLFNHGGASLEGTEKVLHMLFDKTGTLTLGTPHVKSYQLLRDVPDETDTLEAIAAVENSSEHPLARAICNYIREDKGVKGLKRLSWSSTTEGRGVSAVLTDGRRIDVGSESWIQDICRTQHYDRVVSKKPSACSTVVASIDAVPVAIFYTQDEIRPEAKEVISYLQDRMGVVVHMVTGDNTAVAQSVALSVNIPPENVVSNALPWTKIEKVKELSSSKYGVAFLGDGMNDAPAIAAADVGIAIGAGSQIAIATASVVLVRSHLEDVVVALDIARKAFKKVRQNFFWAMCYNLMAVPVAAGCFYPITHTRLSPIVAASMMAMSSLSVVSNSLLLRRYQPPPVGSFEMNTNTRSAVLRRNRGYELL